MTRSLKTFMRNRKAEMLGCGPCVCRTMQCRRYASENCGCGEGSTEDMISYIMSWFQNTPVFNDLTPEQKTQALADAQEILEGAGDDITPFYNAVRQGRTFANYVERLGLTVDENGPCDSSVYEDNETFIIYISTAGAIDCKYLALVARRGLTPTQELVNKDEISAYLDWVTTEQVTYQFKDWDGEILKFGSVNKGETPVAPENPARQGYKFTGWSPEVGPISRDTTFVAQYVVPVADIVVEGTAGSYGVPVNVELGKTTTINCTYSPANATDFSDIALNYWSYDADVASMSFASTGAGTGTITLHGDIAGRGVAYIKAGETTCSPGLDITVIEMVKPSSFSNVSKEDVEVEVGGHEDITVDYLPTNANDFSGVTFVEATYATQNRSAEIISYENGVATIRITGLEEGGGGMEMYLDGTFTGIAVDITIQQASY